MYSTEDVYKVLRFHIPASIYQNEEYYPFIMAMAELLAKQWNSCEDLESMKDPEKMSNEFLKFAFEGLGYKESVNAGSGNDFSTRMFLKNFLNILKKRGTEQSIVSAVQFAGNMEDLIFSKSYVPKVKVVQHIGEDLSENPWEYDILYPMELDISKSLLKYVKPSGQKAHLAPAGYENYGAYYFDRYGVVKQDMHGDVKLFMHTGGAYDNTAKTIVGGTINNTMVVSNMIVNKASKFIAKRMKAGTSWGSGIGYLAVGTGYGSGSLAVPQPEDATYVQLRNELARKAFTSCSYLDASGNVTVTETNVLQYVFTFGTSEAIGNIVEMGLFGGDATVTINSGYMFNYKVIPYWNKVSGKSLTVVWTITY
jgi:hypothetical protein